MGAVIEYKKDGYIFQLTGDPIPWPVARIDENGNEIPLTLEEHEEWERQYIKDHPEVENL